MTRWISDDECKITYRDEKVYIAEYVGGTLYLTLTDGIIIIRGIGFVLAFGPEAMKDFLEEMGMRFE